MLSGSEHSSDFCLLTCGEPEEGSGGDVAPGDGEGSGPFLEAAGAECATAGTELVAACAPALLRQQPPEADNPLMAALDAIDGKDWQALTEPLIRPILIRAIAEPESLLADLAELYPELDTSGLEEQLARIIFVADTIGQLDRGTA